MKKLMGKSSVEGGFKDEEFKKTSNYDKTFKPLRRLQDPRFGEVNLLTNVATKENVIVKERKFNDKAEMIKAILATRAKMANQTPHNLRLLDYSTTKQSELCSTIYILRQFYEHFGNDLRREFMNRQAANAFFTPYELGEILYKIVKANPSGIHGDICPSNIIYDKNTQAIKLVDRSDEIPTTIRALNIQKNKMSTNQPLYQSPSMHSNLKRNNLKFSFDSNKEDAFMLGLTLLELGNLKSVSNIYDASRKEIDSAALNAHLEDFKTRYGHSSYLSQVVDGLTKTDELQRLGIKELDASLPNEIELKNRISSTITSYIPGQIVTSTTTPIVTTSHVGGIEERVTRIDTTVTTTPIITETLPSIYNEANFNTNAFYEKPPLPSLNQQAVATEYKYIPPATTTIAPVSHISVSRTDLTSIPAEVRSVNTVVTGNQKTYTSLPVVQGYGVNTANYTSYKNNDPTSTFSTLPSGYAQYSTHASYAPGTANRIVLEPEIRREVITAAPVTQSSYYTSNYIPATIESAGTVYTQPANQVVYTTPQTTTSYAPSYVSGGAIRRSYSQQGVSVAQPTRISTYQATPATYLTSAPVTYETSTITTNNVQSTNPYVTEAKTYPTMYTNYQVGSNTQLPQNYQTTYDSYAPTTYTTYDPVTTLAPSSYQPTITTETYERVNNPMTTTSYVPATTYLTAAPTVNVQPATEYITTSTVIPQTTYVTEPTYQYTTASSPITYAATNYNGPSVTTKYQNTSPAPYGSSKQIKIPSSTNVTHYTTEYVSNKAPVEYLSSNGS